MGSVAPGADAWTAAPLAAPALDHLTALVSIPTPAPALPRWVDGQRPAADADEDSEAPDAFGPDRDPTDDAWFKTDNGSVTVAGVDAGRAAEEVNAHGGAPGAANPRRWAGELRSEPTPAASWRAIAPTAVPGEECTPVPAEEIRVTPASPATDQSTATVAAAGPLIAAPRALRGLPARLPGGADGLARVLEMLARRIRDGELIVVAPSVLRGESQAVAHVLAALDGDQAA